MLTWLKLAWKYISKGLKFIGKVQSVILLSVVYFLILGMVAIPFQLVKQMEKKPRRRSFWLPRRSGPDTEETLLRQF